MEFYNKIDFLCDLKGISRKKMCESIGLSYNTYNSMLKRQSSNVTLDVVEAIADFFGVSVDYLVKDSIKYPELKDINSDPSNNGHSPDLVNVAGLSDRDKHEINELIKIKLGANETEPKVVDIKRSPRIRLAGKGGDPVSIGITEEHSKKIKEAFEENNK